MQFSYKLRGLRQLQDKLKVAPGDYASANRIALGKSVDFVRALIAGGLPSGPGHFGGHLRDTLRTNVRGGLKRQYGDVFTDLPQGRWRELGTKAHEIVGRGKPLDVAGQPLWSVHHPGQQPRPVFHQALRSARSTIRGYFVEALERLSKGLATSG